MSKRPPDDDGRTASPKRPKIAGQPLFLPPKGDLSRMNPGVGCVLAFNHAEDTQVRAKIDKAAEVAARLAKLNPQSTLDKAKPKTEDAPPKPDISEIAKRVQDARRKTEQLVAKQRNVNPYLMNSAPPKQSTSSAKIVEAAPRHNAGIHPLLMGLGQPIAPLTSKDRYKPMLPKFASTKANARIVQAAPVRKPIQLEIKTAGPTLEEARQDPHFDRRLGIESLQPRNKKGRSSLRFVQRGKYVKEGDAKRQEAKMEALRAKIAEAARKAGIEDEMEDGALNKKVKKVAPPLIEWWDVAFVDGDTYEDLDKLGAQRTWEASCSDLVQHPIALPAPGDKKDIKERGMMLTKKERKKVRRQRRAAEMKDHQDRVKMGLLPPDPPKVKLSNMMRVLTQEAIQDPTMVEAKVRREMMLRRTMHERNNSERKLTSEQRNEKRAQKAVVEENKGIYRAAFCIKDLSNIKNKKKVRFNVEQNHMRGVGLYAPKFVLVIVEGSGLAVKKYKHLMLDRIDWTEEAIITGTNKEEDVEERPVEPVDVSDNTCELIWEGEDREHRFNHFSWKNFPSDHLCREFLGPKLEGIYDMARKSLGEEVGM